MSKSTSDEILPEIQVHIVSRYVGTEHEKEVLPMLNTHSAYVQDWLKSIGYQVKTSPQPLRFTKKAKTKRSGE